MSSWEGRTGLGHGSHWCRTPAPQCDLGSRSQQGRAHTPFGLTPPSGSQRGRVPGHPLHKHPRACIARWCSLCPYSTPLGHCTSQVALQWAAGTRGDRTPWRYRRELQCCWRSPRGRKSPRHSRPCTRRWSAGWCRRTDLQGTLWGRRPQQGSSARHHTLRCTRWWTVRWWTHSAPPDTALGLPMQVSSTSRVDTWRCSPSLAPPPMPTCPRCSRCSWRHHLESTSHRGTAQLWAWWTQVGTRIQGYRGRSTQGRRRLARLHIDLRGRVCNMTPQMPHSSPPGKCSRGRRRLMGRQRMSWTLTACATARPSWTQTPTH